MVFRITILLLLFSSSSGFVQEFIAKTKLPPLIRKPELDTNTNALVTGIPLDINLQIGKKGDEIFSVRNLVVNLDSKACDENYVTAPTSDQTSYQAHISKSGHYVDRHGLQTLDLASPCWQLIWRDQAPAGNCVIGLDVLKGATRNDATLKAGHLFVSFPVWKQERLAEFQTHKAECELAAMVHLQQRDAEIAKMKETNNILAKAWHYRNAFAAVEKYHMQPVRSMAAIPSDDDVIAISDSLLLARLGTIWTKTDKGFGLFSNTYMGTASLKAQPAAAKQPQELSLSELAP